MYFVLISQARIYSRCNLDHSAPDGARPSSRTVLPSNLYISSIKFLCLSLFWSHICSLEDVIQTGRRDRTLQRGISRAEFNFAIAIVCCRTMIMVPHVVWKTWPEGLSRQKLRPKAEVFVVTEARGPCFFTRHEGPGSNPIIARSLIDFFSAFYSREY